MNTVYVNNRSEVTENSTRLSLINRLQLFLFLTVCVITLSVLTHFPLVPHICVSELSQQWCRKWLVTWSAPSHYLNHCWIIVDWALKNKIQWNSNQNTKLFIHENAFENVVCEMTAILSRAQCIKRMWRGSKHTGGSSHDMFDRDWKLIACFRISTSIVLTLCQQRTRKHLFIEWFGARIRSFDFKTVSVTSRTRPKRVANWTPFNTF